MKNFLSPLLLCCGCLLSCLVACADAVDEAPAEGVDAAAPVGGSATFDDRTPRPESEPGDAGQGEGGSAGTGGDAGATEDLADAAVEKDGGVDCTPSPELCNLLDDDCDGIVDEDPQRLQEECEMELPGLCNRGALSCVGGALVCEQTVAPMEESCDGGDNDCDGVTDEDVDGAMCETGEPGLCGAGVQVCSEGRYSCERPEAQEEVCNGVDDDCNGAVDDLADGSICGCGDGAPTLQVQASCGPGGYEPSSHIGICAPTELHIVGQYEAADDGESEVEITRTASPIVLVLSSYEPTRWLLNIGPGVQLTQIIINGYEASNLANPPEGVEVLDLTGPGRYLSACAYVWPGDDQGCDTQSLVRGAERQTGLTLTSFQGCYSGAGFILRDSVRP